MKRISIIGLCFAAILALGAMAASSASALPQFYHCSSVNKGELTRGFTSTATCEALSTVGTTVFWAEFSNAEVEGIKATGGGGSLVAAGLPTVTCTSTEATKGEITSTNTSMTAKKVEIEFKGCTATVLGIKVNCTTSGKPAGTIATNAQTGTIGYTSSTEKDAKHVGIVFGPEQPALSFSTFACAGTTITVTGQVVGLFPEKNIGGTVQIGTASAPVMTKSIELRFECEPAGTSKQRDQGLILLPSTIVTGNLHLIANATHESCVEGNATVTSTNPIEIMA